MDEPNEQPATKPERTIPNRTEKRVLQLKTEIAKLADLLVGIGGESYESDLGDNLEQLLKGRAALRDRLLAEVAKVPARLAMARRAGYWEHACLIFLERAASVRARHKDFDDVLRVAWSRFMELPPAVGEKLVELDPEAVYRLASDEAAQNEIRELPEDEAVKALTWFGESIRRQAVESLSSALLN